MPAYSNTGSTNNGDETTITVVVEDDGGGGGGGAGGTGAPYDVDVVLTIKDGDLHKVLNSGNPAVDHKLTSRPSVRWRDVTITPGTPTTLSYRFDGMYSMSGSSPYCVVVFDTSGTSFSTEWRQVNPALFVAPTDFVQPISAMGRLDPRELKSRDEKKK
jgi:hypothetical protein